MSKSSSSSAQFARQALADGLRDIRRDAGLSGSALAAAAGWHGVSKVSKIEHGTRSPSPADIRAWCRICGVSERTDELLAELRAVDSLWVDWQRMERTGLRQAQESVLPLFERTQIFRAYSCWVFPGLIQTEAYTRAMLRAIAKRRMLPDDVEEAVAVRMERQRVLHWPGKTFAFLVEEFVLRAGVGGTEVMAEQLDHLVQVATLPSVSIGVVPSMPDRDTAWPVEEFWIYDSAQVNVELISGYLTITQPREVAMYADVFSRLASIAVYGQQARSLIQKASEDMH